MLNKSLNCALFVLLVGLLTTNAGAQSASVSIQFAPSTDAISNPERGLVGWAGDLADPWEDGIVAEAARGYPTQRTHIRLDAFRDRDLSEDFLTGLSNGFDAVRRAGVKVIPRFVYNSPKPGPTYRFVAKDAALNRVVRHIEQLAPVLRAHHDVIAYFEAGFIGAWGEWHSSSNGLTKPAAKSRIKDALFEHFPRRPIMFRTPRDIRRWLPQAELAQASQFGFHNDCFLSNETDANTFTEQSDREYAQTLTQRAPFGGETCAVGARSSCDEILTQGRQYHLTWLNRFGQLSAFTPTWKKQGCYQEVVNRIGYRFELRSLSHPVSSRAGSRTTLSIQLRNTGWSRLHNARPLVVYWIDRDNRVAATTAVQSVSAAQWHPNASDEDHQVVFAIKTPRPGNYRLALGLPDAARRLSGDRRFAIRFANSDRHEQGQYWDAGRAIFMTGTRIKVTN